MKKIRLLTVAMATTIILTGCTSGIKYDKAMKLMDEGKHSEAVQIYDKLNDEDKVRFNKVVDGYIQENMNNLKYNEIDTVYNAINNDLKDSIKDTTKDKFEDIINTSIMENNHDKIIEIIEKMNGEIKDLSQLDDEYLKNDSILNGVEESLENIYEKQEIKKYDEAMKKLEGISANYGRLDRVEEVKQELTQKKNETIEKLYNEIVEGAQKYLIEKDFENAYRELTKVIGVVPSKKEDAEILKVEWEEQEKEYIIEQKKILMAKMKKIGSHEESETEFYKTKGTKDTIAVEEFYFEVTANLIKGVSDGMFISANCPNELPIYVKEVDFIADGEKCKFKDFNFKFKTEEFYLTWAESISKYVLDDEMKALRKFVSAKEAKLVLKGKESEKTFIISKANKNRILTALDFYEIYKK